MQVRRNYYKKYSNRIGGNHNDDYINPYVTINVKPILDCLLFEKTCVMRIDEETSFKQLK